jgi:hypothetical protein
MFEELLDENVEDSYINGALENMRQDNAGLCICKLNQILLVIMEIRYTSLLQRGIETTLVAAVQKRFALHRGCGSRSSILLKL